MNAAEAFQIITKSCVRQFRMNEALLDQLDDPDPLHQARVGLRRLRSALSLFRPMVNDRAFTKLHGELKWLAGSLGTARNIDMLIGRSTDEGVRKAFCSVRSGAYHAAHLALGSRRARRTMLDLAEWLALGDWVVRPHDSRLRDESIRCRAAEILEKRRKRLKRLGSGLVGLDGESLHKVRIEAKKLRYALDFFGSLYEEKRWRA
jgi:CHAD domain-containing protein